jgi:intein/homing endonuclease
MKNIGNIHKARLPENVRKIIKLAETMPYSAIGKLFNIADWNVNKILRAKGVTHKHRGFRPSASLPLVVDYFRIIDSVKKAYWLGYLCADGKIEDNKVMLCSKDREVVEKFKADVGSGHAISKYSYLDDRTNKVYTQHIIQIASKDFSKYISNWGITKNKSSSVFMPNISGKYIPFFIAGLFDGDGWVGIKRQVCRTHTTVTLAINLISTKEMLLAIQDFILKYGISKKALSRWNANKANKNVWYLTLYTDAFKFLNIIYKDVHSRMYLSRKYNIFKKFRDVSRKKTMIGKFGDTICIE